jgi:hypothetical protein
VASINFTPPHSKVNKHPFGAAEGLGGKGVNARDASHFWLVKDQGEFVDSLPKGAARQMAPEGALASGGR